MIIVLSHASFRKNKTPILGTGAFLSPYFKNKNQNYLYIKFPIHSEKFFYIEFFNNGNLKTTSVDHNFSKNLLFKSIQELLLARRFFSKVKNIELVLSIDPLNSLYSLILLKYLGIKKTIFYTADYALKRFNNPIMNSIYHAIDNIAIKNSDYVWNVSTRITDVRKRQGIKDDRNFFVPNAPLFDYSRIAPYDSANRFRLIAVTTLSNSIDFNSIFSAIAEVKKKHSQIDLTIVGKGNWEEKFSELLERHGVKENIKFYGAMDYSELLVKLKKSGVGIALYTNENPWTYYCDSMKARDYLACGLPVIISSISSTADDIEKYKAGFSIDSDFRENLLNILNTFFSDEEIYKQYRTNAISLAKKYDIETILDRTFSLCKINI